jgi:lipoprotein-anchoring transpeptidase ErfK/SrfK
MINAFDPITNQSVLWSVAPEQWGQWLTTENTADGVRLSLDNAQLGGYLSGQNLGGEQFIQIDQSVQKIQAAIASGSAEATIQVFHRETQYSVVPGDTLGSIAWKMGIPMWRITNANPGINLDALNPGQTITIPSRDDMLPVPIVYNKRIVVSISEQHMWVYENGQLKWDWIASTGIDDSPTMPGVYQVLSHDGTAYAGNWNLYMPSFMSIYEAVPGFHNGIHGFPSRGGSQILWENSLGRRVTYGCILLSSTNASLLYDWAEEGVIVEIKR